MPALGKNVGLVMICLCYDNVFDDLMSFIFFAFLWIIVFDDYMVE